MDNNQVFLEVKDHTVSGEVFKLLYNEELDLLKTSPQPSEDKLNDYYESEDYISHTNSRRNTFEKIYHYVRSIALKQKLKLINSFSVDSKNLLDIGCGTGDFLELAKQNKWNVHGIEPNENARALANGKVNNNVSDLQGLLNFEPHNFDVITLWHVLEHLPNLEKQISVLKRLIKPNGKIIIAVPNYKSFDASYYKKYWAAFDAPRHLWHFSQSSISKLFSKEQMEVEKILPLRFDAYYVSLLSEKYKSGWMNFFSAFFVATRSNLKAGRTGEYSSLIYVIKNTTKSN